MGGVRCGPQLGLSDESVDVVVGFIPSELARGLTLGQLEGSSGVSEVPVTGRHDQVEEFLHLLGGCGRTGGLTECHVFTVYAGSGGFRDCVEPNRSTTTDGIMASSIGPFGA